jgi:hypothetical protein
VWRVLWGSGCGGGGVSYAIHQPYGEREPRDCEGLYLIWCREHQHGATVLWWRPQGKGYTTRLDEAGLYTRQEAESQARDRDCDVAVPARAAERAAFRTCNASNLRDAMEAT